MSLYWSSNHVCLQTLLQITRAKTFCWGKACFCNALQKHALSQQKVLDPAGVLCNPLIYCRVILDSTSQRFSTVSPALVAAPSSDADGHRSLFYRPKTNIRWCMHFIVALIKMDFLWVTEKSEKYRLLFLRQFYELFMPKSCISVYMVYKQKKIIINTFHLHLININIRS